MIRRRVALFLLLAALLTGYYAQSGEQKTPNPDPPDPKATPPVPARIQPILAALKRGDSVGALRPFLALDRGEFERWLGTTLTKGKSRRQDVLRLFGPHCRDLDRPARDPLTSLQYELGDWGHLVSLVFHFDANGTLAHWSISQAICGFCPHVYAHDRRWRLEGKLLAGCVGLAREGSDTLLLPRLRLSDGLLRVKLANLAPEVEYLDEVKLGYVALEDGEELDVSADGSPVVWRPGQQIEAPLLPNGPGQEGFSLELDPSSLDQVVVLDAFNTSAFESLMRESLLRPAGKGVDAALRVDFDRGAGVMVAPVGTKFLRRIVVPVPAGTRTVRLRAPAGLWYVPRSWTGSGRAVEKDIRWRSPSAVQGPTPEAHRLLAHADQQRVRLDPGQEVVLSFSPAPGPRPAQRVGFVLRMRGYYEFLQGARPRAR